jgi:PHS family inorganic phosphate transporter-like MFS transporter
LWQTVGSAAPFAVGFVFADLPFNVLWRIIVGLGAVPAAAGLYFACGAPESESFTTARSSGNAASAGCIEGFQDMVRANSGLLAGTAGAWFLFDIAYYGTVLFTPTMLTSIFGNGLHIRWLCALNVFVLLFQLPGQLLTRWVLGTKQRSLVEVQVVGFVLFAVAFAIFAAVVHWLGSAVQFVALLAMLLVIGFGPNITTYVYPTQCYDAEVRSSAHGFSSASGKLGALTGTIVFPAIMAVGRLEHVALVQLAVSILGAIVSFKFLPRLETGNDSAELLPRA